MLLKNQTEEPLAFSAWEIVQSQQMPILSWAGWYVLKESTLEKAFRLLQAVILLVGVQQTKSRYAMIILYQERNIHGSLMIQNIGCSLYSRAKVAVYPT